MFFPSTYQQEIVEICASLRSGSAAGFDNIHIDVVKQNIDIISKPLTRIINLSLSSGIVPKQLKIARIIPLFKSGDQDLYANYRPVSVLLIFSKFLEKVVYISRTIGVIESLQQSERDSRVALQTPTNAFCAG